MNEKVTPEEMIKLLRCSASPAKEISIAELGEKCKVCKYKTQKRTPRTIFLCDLDRMMLDAADMIDEFEKRLEI